MPPRWTRNRRTSTPAPLCTDSVEYGGDSCYEYQDRHNRASRKVMHQTWRSVEVSEPLNCAHDKTSAASFSQCGYCVHGATLSISCALNMLKYSRPGPEESTYSEPNHVVGSPNSSGFVRSEKRTLPSLPSKLPSFFITSRGQLISRHVFCPLIEILPALDVFVRLYNLLSSELRFFVHRIPINFPLPPDACNVTVRQNIRVQRFDWVSLIRAAVVTHAGDDHGCDQQLSVTRC